MNLIAFSIFSVCLTGLPSCDKNQPRPKTELEKLPAATQKGAYTFGCLVNGKALVNRTTLDISAVNQLGWLQIGANFNNNPTDQVIFMFIDDPDISVKSYFFNDSIKFYAIYADYRNYPVICEYRADGFRGNGVLNITRFDWDKLIVSGTFNFKAWTTRCDTINVTDGRFDLHFIP